MPDQNNPVFPVSPAAPAANPPTGQSTPQTNQSVNPVVTTDPDVPPLPPDFQNIKPAPIPTPMAPPEEKPDESGTASPDNLPPVISTPKKKFGGKRIIATILGILLLVGGVGAGLLLTQQQQLFEQQAAGGWCPGGKSRVPKGGTQADCPGGGKPAPVSQTTSSGQTVQPGQFGYVYSQNGDKGQAYIAGTYIADNGQRYLVGGSGANDTLKAAANYCDKNDCNNLNLSQTTKNQINQFATTGNTGSNLGPINCSDSSVSGWASQTSYTETEPCPGGGYLIEKVKIDASGNKVQWCTSDNSNCKAKTTTTTTTTTTSSAQCSSVGAYDATWNLITPAQLSTLAVGTTINFCVGGTTSGGGFDKAKFTINGVAQTETTTKGSGTAGGLFCQSYQIPTGVTSFNVTGQIHDATLGWSN